MFCFVFPIDLIVKYLAAHPWDGKMITDRIINWLEEMKKNDDSVITPVLRLETTELGGFTEITNMWRGPGTHVIITKKNIQFEIFQIQFLPIKLH